MADVFAVTVTRTNTNVEMLGETMKYAAPVAKAFGASMEETAALAGIMANSGIKASQAGTSLRAGFLRLAGPPKKSAKAMQELGISLSDAQAQQEEAREALDALGISMDDVSGKPKKMAAILTELKNKTAELGQEERLATLQKIFGTEAATGWLAVLDAGPEVFEKLVDEMENSDGEAQKMAETMMNNAKGAITQFKSALEGLGISIGNIFLPALTEGMKGIAGLTGKASAWVKENEGLVKGFVEIAAGIGASALMFKSFCLGGAAVEYVSKSIDLFIATQENAVAGQTLLSKATHGLAKGMGTLKTSLSGNMFSTLGDQAVDSFNRMKAIKWADIGNGIKTSLDGAKTAMQSKWQTMANAYSNFSFSGAARNTKAGFAEAFAKGAETISGAAKGAGNALKGMGKAMLNVGRAGLTAMFSPLGIALMAIAGAAYLIYTNWDKVGPFFMELWGRITEAVGNAWTMIQPAIELMGAALAQLGQTIMTAFDSMSSSGVFDALIQAAQMLATIFGGALVGAFILFANVAVGVVTTAIGIVASVITGAIGVFTGLIQFITGVFAGDWSAAWNGIVGIFSSIFGMLGNIADSILGGIRNTVNGIISSIKGLAGFGGGGNDVSHNAHGGIYRKGAFLTTFAEESPEAAIPLDGSQRAISLWQQAGEMLGVGAPEGGASPAGLWNKAVDLFDFGGGGKTSAGEGVPMPTINISLTVNGNADPGSIKQAVLDVGQRAQRSFAEEMEAFTRRKARLAY